MKNKRNHVFNLIFLQLFSLLFLETKGMADTLVTCPMTLTQTQDKISGTAKVGSVSVPLKLTFSSGNIDFETLQFKEIAIGDLNNTNRLNPHCSYMDKAGNEIQLSGFSPFIFDSPLQNCTYQSCKIDNKTIKNCQGLCYGHTPS